MAFGEIFFEKITSEGMYKALLAKGKMTARYFQTFSSGLETSSAFDLNIWCFFIEKRFIFLSLLFTLCSTFIL